MLKNYFIIGLTVYSLSLGSKAVEITALLGQMYSSDLTSTTDEQEFSVDDGNNFALAIAWQESPNGQGQLMINAVSHDFTNTVNNQEYSLDIIYAHFNGIAQFRQQNYVTTVSLGLGGAYFDSDINEEVYPSATLAFGTRYEFSKTVSLVTEIRGYASLVDDDDNLFCSEDVCHAQFDDTLWIESNISVGIAVKF